MYTRTLAYVRVIGALVISQTPAETGSTNMYAYKLLPFWFCSQYGPEYVVSACKNWTKIKTGFYVFRCILCSTRAKAINCDVGSR